MDRRAEAVLTQAQVAPYLVRRGLLAPQAVVEGDLAVFDTTRRNSNFKVVCERHPSFLLKQGRGEERRETVAREAAAYHFLTSRTGPAARRLAPYLPRFHGYEPRDGVLVLELLPGALSLAEHQLKRARFPLWPARATGRALAALHSIPLPAGEEVRPCGAGWALTAHRQSSTFLRESSLANLELVRIIQSFPELGLHLDRLRAEWSPKCYIHGDVKADNVVLSVPRGRQGPGQARQSRRRRIALADWELSGVGDPAWDLACVFASYLDLWVMSIPVTGDEPPGRFIHLARHPLSRMQPAMRAFWQSYTAAMGLPEGDALALLLKATRYTAARLVDTANSYGQYTTSVQAASVLFLQVALNILQSPAAALTSLLGIHPVAGPPR